MNEKILIIDDEDSIRDGFKKILSLKGYVVDAAMDQKTAFRLLDAKEYEIVLLDINLKGTSGLKMLSKIKKKSQNTKVIMITGYASIDSVVTSLRDGASDFLEKPIETETLLATIKRNLIKANYEQYFKDKERGSGKNDQIRGLLAPVMHEIRGSLNLIVGYTQLLREMSLENDQKRCLEAIQTGETILVDLADKILDFAKIEGRSLSIEEKSFNLEYLVYDIINLIMQEIKKKQINYTYLIEDNVPRNVVGDPGRIRQVLINLLTNAMKFTEKGAIHLSVSLEDNFNEGYGLKFKVSDTGIGIPADKQKALFTPFYQAHKDSAKNNKGVGLGLSICKSLVEMMGGSIHCDSKENQGTTFTFSVRLKKSAIIECVFNLADKSELQGENLAVVGVDPKIVDIMRLMLKEYEFQWISLNNTQELLSRLSDEHSQGQKEKCPKAIFLGDNIPLDDMGGYVKLIKNKLAQGVKCKLIFLSAERRAGIVKDARDFGFDGFLPAETIISRNETEFLNFLRLILGETSSENMFVTRHLANEIVLVQYEQAQV